MLFRGRKSREVRAGASIPRHLHPGESITFPHLGLREAPMPFASHLAQGWSGSSFWSSGNERALMAGMTTLWSLKEEKCEQRGGTSQMARLGARWRQPMYSPENTEASFLPA